MSLVFLSHVSEDKVTAQRVATALAAAGHEVWWDDLLPAHRTFSEVIEERLRAAQAVVVLWSKGAAQSQWVRAEADVARTLGTLIQITLDGEMPPLPFNQIHCAQLAGWAGESDHREWQRVLQSVVALSEQPAGQSAVTPVRPRPARPRARAIAAIAVVTTVALGALIYFALDRSPDPAPSAAEIAAPAPAPAGTTAEPFEVRYHRVTEFVGIEETPAASPDGKMVAYVAPAQGPRQIWVQILAGGPPLQVTRGDREGLHPRWLPDASALIYFTPSEIENNSGTLWEVPALGGTPRRLTDAYGGADVSRDGSSLALVRRRGAELVLAIVARDGKSPDAFVALPEASDYSTPRWSPDGKSIALLANEGGLSQVLHVFAAASGSYISVARANNIRGLTWLSDGSGLVYAAPSRGALLYPPVFQLRRVSRDGSLDRAVTIGDISYVDPDLTEGGDLFASQISMQSDIWRFPVAGSPAENVRNGVRVTRQTGHVQTPSASPDGRQVAYLSDTGGHANIWVLRTDGTAPLQVTFERDPAVLIGLPIWSPRGDSIVFVKRTEDVTGEWLIAPDGSSLRQIVPSGVAAQWSADGRWLYYYTPPNMPTPCIERVPTDGGAPELVRCGASSFAVSSDARTLYFAQHTMQNHRLFKASPPDAEAEPFAEYAPSRIPFWPQGFVLSPDDRLLALPLKDGATTNIWTISTDDGRFRQITDFGRPTLIGRQVSWAPDGQSIYAALAELDANIVVLHGLAR